VEIFCSSPWVPVEWIQAHGLEPRGVWSLASGSGGSVPEGVCAFAQQCVDFTHNQPDAAFIFTTACDQMRRAADTVAGRHPRLFLFNLPATWQTPAARRLYHNEVGRLGRFLVQCGGRAPGAEEFETVLLEWDQRRHRLRDLLPQTNARQAAELLMDFFHDGHVPDVVPRPTASGVPLALVGGPLLRSQLDLLDAVKGVGGRVVLNAAEPGERCLLPPLPPRSPGRPPLALLADHYFDQAIDVFHRPNSRLYAWLGARLADRGVRGIILQVHVGCDLWRAEAASFREAWPLPVLVLEAHEGRGFGQRDLTRLGAFVESLQ
jgi:benzoyl-CoA reductase/2-hydroxyglutaryl-CoA dehydratase subunit BcrC/BadD/HgdB